MITRSGKSRWWVVCGGVLRQHEPRMDDEVGQAPCGRSPYTSPHPEMASGGNIGRWPMVGDKGRDPARSRGLSPARPRGFTYVFDLWVGAWRKKVARGDVMVTRYADDLVVGFENRAEAKRFLEAFR